MAEDDAGDKLAKQLKDIETRLTAAETDRDKWKELSRKHEERSKANDTAADELKRLKESKQTDEEKVSAKLAELEKRANDAEARSLRAEVATAKGLSAAQAKRLQGGTREELETDADDLLESFPVPDKGDGEGKGKPAGQAAASRKPSEQLRGGGDPTEDPVETNPAKLAAEVPRF